MAPGRKVSPSELNALRARLAEAEETIRVIRNGEIDAVIVPGIHGPQVFTLQGAEHIYRVLIESMHEGALTLNSDAIILYANQCFASMVRTPLEQVIGTPLTRFLDKDDRTLLKRLLRSKRGTGSKTEFQLRVADGNSIPVQVSMPSFPRHQPSSVAMGMVVTDLSETRRTESLLRSLAHRSVKGEEVERGRVAHELHDNITQLLCALLFRSQALAAKVSVRDSASAKEAVELCDLLGVTASEVERISRRLRPGVLEHLGVELAILESCTDFTKRLGLPVKLDCRKMPQRLPPDLELTLYRILQEALKNIELHARATQVVVRLRLRGEVVAFSISDDGEGFSLSDRNKLQNAGPLGLGLAGMREQAKRSGGGFVVKSSRSGGTQVRVRLPVPSAPVETN